MYAMVIRWPQSNQRDVLDVVRSSVHPSVPTIFRVVRALVERAGADLRRLHPDERTSSAEKRETRRDARQTKSDGVF